MPYADLHCDSLSYCVRKNLTLTNSDGHINLQKLNRANCILQCFAVFTNGENALTEYQKQTKLFEENKPFFKTTTPLLTVENLGFLNDERGVSLLKSVGVKMASLVWNEKNKFAHPCGEGEGLSSLGKKAVEALNGNNILLDISHLSPKGAKEAFEIATLPVVASHSNCLSVCEHKRNLSDTQIRKIARSGGVVGLNFFPDFLGHGGSFEGARAHLEHLFRVGGEDILAIGSDFDGVPYLKDFSSCLSVPKFLEYLSGFLPYRILEKFAHGNVERLFKETL